MKNVPVSAPLRSAALGCALLLLSVNATWAQATRIFVASYGSDANDGSRGAPKRNFQPAHDTVAAGGQVVVLDTAGYGALNINKSVSVTVPPGVNGFITVTGASDSGVIINTGASDVVNLRGLIIEGGGRGAEGTGPGTGIKANSVGTLRVEDCTVRNFDTGLLLNSSVTARLIVSDCQVRNVETGIQVVAKADNVPADAVISRCTVDNARASAMVVSRLGGDFSTAKLTAITVRDCTVTHSGTGLRVEGFKLDLVAEACTISGNNFGIYVNGEQAAVSACTLTNNTEAVVAPGPDYITLTRLNNTFYKNTGNGAFTGTLPAK